ncbi:GtrA family protein [Lachnospiraceae bacterium 45-P1]
MGKIKEGVVKEGIAYLVFGVLTTVIDYVISNALFYAGHMGSISSQTIGWVAAVLFAFVTNKWWVFGSHTLIPAEVWREFVSFVLCRVVTFLFNLAAIFVMVDLLELEFFICKLLISVVVVVLNYVFSKILIFAHKKEK